MRAVKISNEVKLFTPNSSKAFDIQESSHRRFQKKSVQGGVIRIEKKRAVLKIKRSPVIQGCNQRDHRAGGETAAPSRPIFHREGAALPPVNNQRDKIKIKDLSETGSEPK